MRKEERERWLSRKRLKTPFPTSKTTKLWELTYRALVSAFLMGMEHTAVEVEAPEEAVLAESDWFSRVKPLPFEEAIRFLAARVPLTADEFYELERKLRFRAFTVARLTELDAINRVKRKLLEVLREGKTFKQFWEEGGRDEVLRKAGFHRARPWYWETVFRTNLQTAYNAGRLATIRKAPEVRYLEFVGIRDERQTEICRRRTGVIRPADDPWWKANWPPLHFRCRSTVRTISKYEAERRRIRLTPPSRLEDLPSPTPGFGLNPLEAETFWRLTPGMIERARRYGILGEIRALAGWLGLKEVEMENPGTKFYPIELLRTLGTNRKAPVRVGDEVPKWEGSEETTPVKAIYKDLLNNEVWATEFTLEGHISRRIPKDWARFLKEKNPGNFERSRLDFVRSAQRHDLLC